MKKELLMGLSSYREVQEMGPAWSLNGYLYLQIDKETHHKCGSIISCTTIQAWDFHAIFLCSNLTLDFWNKLFKFSHKYFGS